LQHVIADCGATFMFADARLMDRLADVETAKLHTIIVVGEDAPKIGAIKLVPENDVLKPGAKVADPERPIAPWDTEFVLYTSGTTGPAKGAMSSYTHRYVQAWATTCLHPGDRRLVTGPLAHTAGAGAIYTTLCKGGSIALVESFKTDQFWDQVKRFQPQMTSLMGATIPFLLKRAPSPDDKNHSLKTVMVAPVDENAIEFGKRFDVEVYGIYSMTELSVPLFCGPDLDRAGQCGKQPRDGVSIRIVDDNDLEVEDGKSGELIVRCDDPWTMMHGYINNPTATAKVWRNGWFHTGDLFRRDPDGEYVFLDRMNDVVRRRGENISSFEVENAISQFAGVREVAIVGVKSEFSEDEVLAVISPVPGASIDPAALTEFLRPRLPHFMIPRFVRVVVDLPRTATAKIMKQDLRKEGVTADTWDREKHGIAMKREKLA
jgi:crotonobetaine/carnitine-CoA ligase